MKKVELLSPAGNIERLKIALLYGADAVYIGGRDYSLRANAKNFSVEEIEEACKFAHALSKKVYVTVNILFHNEDIEGLKEYLIKLADIGVDAIIVADPVVIDIVRENNIKLSIHISTQASTANIESINFYKELGVERVVLARECSRNEIKEIIDKTGMEVECFIHGAMCAAYSGRCVLSNYFTNRDANRGGCSQVCRWNFNLLNENKEKVSINPEFTMCSKDLAMISKLDDMIDIGISSLKVEGRMRSIYYIATVINTYRSAIDDYYSNKLDNKRIAYYSKVLNRVANRDNTIQFYDKLPTKDEQYFLGREEVSNQDFLGIVEYYDEDKQEVILRQKNYFKEGDIVEFFGPNIETFTYTIPKIYDEENNLLDVARHPEQIIKFKLNKKVYVYDMMRIKVLDKE